jgi:hypothetical protein
MSRYSVLFAICTIAIAFNATSAKAGGHNNFLFKKQIARQQFVTPVFVPPTKNFNKFNKKFVPPQNFNDNVFFTNQNVFVPKHKQINPFLFQAFPNQTFVTKKQVNNNFFFHH